MRLVPAARASDISIATANSHDVDKSNFGRSEAQERKRKRPLLSNVIRPSFGPTGVTALGALRDFVINLQTRYAAGH